jgi:hypothetical protein
MITNKPIQDPAERARAVAQVLRDKGLRAYWARTAKPFGSVTFLHFQEPQRDYDVCMPGDDNRTPEEIAELLQKAEANYANKWAIEKGYADGSIDDLVKK